MKVRKILASLLVVSSFALISGCNNNNPHTTSSGEQQKTLTFENQTVTYDGQAHSLAVNNLPKGATVSYSNNSYTMPGKYSVVATITYEDGSVVKKTAFLTIEKIESVLTAEKVQEAFAYGGVSPTYSLNNTVQTINVPTYYRPGTYTIDLYAEETDIYKESNHVQVTFTVKEGNDLGVKFDSESFVYDGQSKTLEAKDIPAGYRVEYENNAATNPGRYNAKCLVYDSSNELVLTLNAILEVDYPKNEAFENYLDEFFADYLTGDYISINIITIDSESFGITRDENVKAEWYTYVPFDDTDLEEAYNEVLEYKSYLTAFSDQNLSSTQMISYNLLENFFDSLLAEYSPDSNYNPLLYLSYINQFGGYAADFCTYMESYSLRNEQDILDVISYINSLPEAFSSYLTYASDRVEENYPLSDYTIEQMTYYLEDVIDDGDEYYLTQYLQNKIDQCEFLDESKKTNYKDQIKNAMQNSFMPAHETLANGLQQYKGKSTTEGYWASYGDLGKELYQNDLKSLLGIQDLNMDEYGRYLEKTITKYNNKINEVVAKINTSYSVNLEVYNAFFSFLNGSSIVGITDPEEMITYLKEFAKTIVPELEEEPEINIKYMDESAARVSNAVAYYMKSPLDNDGKESITLNGLQLKNDYNSTLATMAHEGYPGHLYAYNFDKELNISNIAKIMTSTAHGEGWATYVESQLWEYVKTHNIAKNENQQLAVELYCDYMYCNNVLSYMAYTYCDYNIHMNSWNVSELKTYLGGLGFDPSIAEEMYRLLIETPTSYAAYGYGLSYFIDLHDNAKYVLKDAYDEVEFNKVIQSHGWCSFDELKKITDQYIQETLHLYNLEQ